MAIKISGTTVIDDTRDIVNVGDITVSGNVVAGAASVNGAITALSGTVSGEFIADSYNETYVSLTGTTVSINCEAGNLFSLTTSGDTTFTFDNPPAANTGYGFILKLTAANTHTITYPNTVNWPSATTPDAPASGETDILGFITYDGGTNWYGFQAGDALG